MRNRSKWRIWNGAIALSGALLFACLATALGRSAGGVIRLRLCESVLPGSHGPLAAAFEEPLRLLIRSETGLDSDIGPSTSPLRLGEMLAQGRADLGIFHGVEFAWAMQRYPQLRPLAIAVNQRPYLWALVVVRSDDEVQRFANLRGTTAALSRRPRLHCLLFLRKECQQLAGDPPARFFGSLRASADCEDALDDVVDKRVRAAIVDGAAFDCYQRRKPGRAQQLRLLVRSDAFPAGVVAYRVGALDSEILHRVRDGLIHARQVPGARQLLLLFRITGFQPVPADYSAALAAIIKRYPTPDPPHLQISLHPDDWER